MKKGFTLIEIVCTLAILSIILAIASPRFREYVVKDRLRIATDKLVSDLRYSKMYAVTKNEAGVNVVFQNAKDSEEFEGYIIYSLSEGNEAKIKEVKLPDGVRICSRGDGCTFDTTNKLTFESGGNVSPFACTITLRDMDTNKREEITLTIGYTRIMRIPK